ncbi:MAG: ThiF family adenylyltransferase, partial [Armatimonadetes bacterium]|nr:ThiF family adenylyltransferase [Armatimonadota bacterium]
DHDTVDLSNLQRQLLYRQADLGRAKLAAAAETLAGINPHVSVVGHDLWLDRTNALEILAGYDLVLNGCDNFPTRYLVNDACVLLGKPCIDGSIYRFDGQVTVYHTAAGGPCYRCRFPVPPPPDSVPSCAEAGVLGVLPGIVGTLQAAEVIKLILAGAGTPGIEPLVGRLLTIDVLTMELAEFRYGRDPDCPVCGEHRTIHELIDYDSFCRGQTEPRESAVETERGGLEIEAPELAEQLQRDAPPVLVDVREEWEWELCRLEGAVHLPLSTVESRAAELPRDRPLVTYCHGGVRSLKALEKLRRAGFQNVRSLAGGIDAWSRLVDPRVPRY